MQVQINPGSLSPVLEPGHHLEGVGVCEAPVAPWWRHPEETGTEEVGREGQRRSRDGGKAGLWVVRSLERWPPSAPAP